MKKTKIICTMGPNTNDKNVMLGLAKNGMDVARFNFSHGDYAEHLGRLEILKEVRKELDIPVAALLDTKGPEIRTGILKDGKKVTLKEGQIYTLTTREIVGDDTIGHINYSGLNEDVSAGNTILIDDGLIELKEGVGLEATKNDIVKNDKNLKIMEIEAAQLPRSLGDVDIAVINGNYAIQADLKVADALAIESAEGTAGTAYVNVLAVKEGRESDPAIQALAKALCSDEVKAFIDETYAGAVQAVF